MTANPDAPPSTLLVIIQYEDALAVHLHDWSFEWTDEPGGRTNDPQSRVLPGVLGVEHATRSFWYILPASEERMLRDAGAADRDLVAHLLAVLKPSDLAIHDAVRSSERFCQILHCKPLLGRETVLSTPDYVVIRPAPDLSSGFLPSDLDGTWFDRQHFGGYDLAFGHGGAIVVPTGRFEIRESDGAIAEVFEVRFVNESPEPELNPDLESGIDSMRRVSQAFERLGEAAEAATRAQEGYIVADHPDLDELRLKFNNLYGGGFE